MAGLALVAGLILGGVLSAVVIFRGIKDDYARRRVFASIRFTDDLAEHRRVADMLKRMYPEFEKTLYVRNSGFFSHLNNDFVYVEWEYATILPGSRGPVPQQGSIKSLVAVGADEVRSLDAHPRIFRRIRGGGDLAAFTILRFPDLAVALKKEAGESNLSIL